MCPDDAEFCIGELESEADWQGLMLVCDVLSEIPPIPRAVVTNFSPLATPQGLPIKEKADPLVECGFKCLTEAYLGDNPNATPDNLNVRATQLGWKTSQPVFGVWNAPLSTYAPWHAWPGCSDYLGEYVP